MKTKLTFFKLVILVIILSTLTINCSKSPEAPVIMDDNAENIYGWVLEKYSSKPVIGVKVLANFEYNTYTDQKGNYKLENIPEGVLYLMFEAQGYDTYIDTMFHYSETEYNTYLMPTLLPNTSVLMGYVKDRESMTVIADAQIECGGIRTTTNENGRFFMFSVPMGIQILSGDASGYPPSSYKVFIDPDLKNHYDLLLSKGGPKEVAINSTKDVYVSSVLPDKNFDIVNDQKYGICLKLAPELSYDGEKRIYVYFDLSEIPSGVTIDTAFIKMLNMGGSVNNSSAIAVCGAKMLSRSNFGSEVNTSWNESLITWNSDLNTAVTNYHSSGWLFRINGPDGHLEADVTLDIKGYMEIGSNYRVSYNGWVIKSFGNTIYEDHSEYKTFYSSDYNSNTRPILTVKYH